MNPRRAIAWAAVGAGVAAYVVLVRPWHQRWGAHDAEVEERLPGDELTPQARQISTRAVTIDAPVERVWPWLVQIGQDKGGFYSYTWLENLVGCRMRNADRVMPECQKLAQGDPVLLHPLAPPLPVERIQPGDHLVLGSNTVDRGTWAFYLRPLAGCRTRLIIRSRGEWKPGLLKWITRYLVFEPAHFVMERKMMLGIKARAEREGGD